MSITIHPLEVSKPWYNKYENNSDISNDGSGTGSGSNNSGGNNTPELEFVDLGLPSGTLWCSCNLGANNPEEFGNVYMWGDPTPYTIGFDENNNPSYLIAPDGTKISGDEDIIPRYKHAFYPSNDLEYWEYKLSKYNADAELGIVDYLTELQPMDDAAYLYNKEYRTPSIIEINELIEFTSVEKIHEYDFGFMLLKLTSRINGNYIYVYSISYISDGIMWANSLITPSYGGTSYDVAAKMSSSNGNYIEVGANLYYGTFYRYRPTFIRPVKYGNVDHNIININLEYLFSNGTHQITNYITYAKLVNAYITRKPIFDTHSKTFLTNLTVNESNGTVEAYLPLVGDYNDGKDQTFDTRLRGITATPDGTISYLTYDV